MITQVAELLPKLRQGSVPLIRLADQIIRRPTFTFDRVLAIKPAPDLVAGLSPTVPSINLITLRLLGKASRHKSDSDIVAGQPHVVAALIQLWLCTTQLTVMKMAYATLLGLLNVGREGVNDRQLIEENLMWRRLFRDRDVYGSIFAFCSAKHVGQESQLDKPIKTVAQGRLLDLLVEIDSEHIRSSQFPDIERAYDVVDGGLLQFATIHMIDVTNDVLMHMNLMCFFTNFLRGSSPNSDPYRALDYMVQTGLHSRTISYFIEPLKCPNLYNTLLYGESAQYVSVYASMCASHLLSQPSTLESILKRLSTVFSELTSIPRTRPHAWASDVAVLSSLPRASLRSRPHLQMLAASLDQDDNLERRRPVGRAEIGSQILTMGR